MSSISDWQYFTRGGQQILHTLRMGLPVARKVVGMASVIFLLVSLGLIWRATVPYERYVAFQYAWATGLCWVNDQATTTFKEANGTAVTTTFAAIKSAPRIQAVMAEFQSICVWALKLGLEVALLILVLMVYGLRQWGKLKAAHTHLTGDVLVTEAVAKKCLKQQGKFSGLRLGSLPLPQGIECTHFLFHGTTGTGKSTAIKALLDQIRKRGDRAIIYDKSCNYLEEFYQPSDVLLNPLDARGRAWDIWAECRNAADFDSIAAAQIPMPLSTQDPFWVNAARTIFAATAFKMRNDPARSIPRLLQCLLSADLGHIQAYLKGTEAETLVSEKIEKAALSIKSVLATYLKSLKYLTQEGAPFSIRRWIQDERASHWLLVTSLADCHDTLKPLMSTWLDIAVNALLSLPPSPKRRIWLILDELPSLQQLPYLTATLSESRKFGGCVVIGVQNMAQLEKVYGSAGARDISALLNTRVLFREPDPTLAQWSAQNLGESVREETHESLSYGAQALRENVSLHRQEARKPLVTASEIMQLPNLHAYLRLPGKFPISTVTFPYKKRTPGQQGFVARPLDVANPAEPCAIDSEVETARAMIPSKKTRARSTEKTFKTKSVNEDFLDI